MLPDRLLGRVAVGGSEMKLKNSILNKIYFNSNVRMESIQFGSIYSFPTPEFG